MTKKDVEVHNGVVKEQFLKNDCHVVFNRWEMKKPKIHTTHCHDFFTIDYIYEGEFVQILNGIEYTCPEGTVSLLSPLDYHSYENKSEAKMISLTFTDDVIFKEVWEVLDIDFTPCVTVFEGADNQKMMEDLLEIENQIKSDLPLVASFTRAVTNCILIDIIQNAHTSGIAPQKKYDIVQKAISYLRKHYREQITLKELAKMCYVTPEHLCRYFKNQTGLTFKEYIITLRLDYAMRNIKHTDKTITEICFESGFSSPSYFTKVFCRRFGKTPAQVREKYK